MSSSTLHHLGNLRSSAPSRPVIQVMTSEQASPYVQTMKRAKAKSQNTSGTSSDDDSEDDSDQEAQPFNFPGLPNEIKNLIVEAAVDYGPAIVYADCKLEPSSDAPPALVGHRPRPMKQIAISRSPNQGNRSEFRNLFNLAKALPEFKPFLELNFGVDLRHAARNPTEALRPERDLLVVIIKKARTSYDWLGHARVCGLHCGTHGLYNPSIRNIGVRYVEQDCYSLGCICDAFNRNMVRRHNGRAFCPHELSALCKNFSHLENVFVLVLLKPSHMLSPHWRHKAGVKAYIEYRLKIARRHNLAIFEDKDRTWVEVDEFVKSQLDAEVSVVVDLLSETFQNFRKRDVRIRPATFPRNQVNFRMLVSNYWMKV